MKSAKNKRSISQKIIRFIVYSLTIVFALIGFFLTTAFFAVKLHVTNDPGGVDYNDRYFQELRDKYGKTTVSKKDTVSFSEAKLFHNVLILNKYYPENSIYILDAYLKSHNLKEAGLMLAAVNLRMQDNSDYSAEINDYRDIDSVEGSKRSKGSVFEWMNIPEWEDFKIAVAKDKQQIDSVSMLTGVEPRLIVSVLVAEQIRLFNSEREAYKKWIGPLKILSVESTFSLGVTGVKAETAKLIEENLKNKESVFYPGEKYEHLLDFQTNSVEDERYQRLTTYKSHFYSYLYAALNIKQIKVQWERAGYPISDRPEILATLYNIGFEGSKPKPNPMVGGSTLMIHEKPYTFGSVAYEYYYSGELFDLFPFKSSKFDWENV